MASRIYQARFGSKDVHITVAIKSSHVRACALIHGHKAFAQVEKLKHLGVAFKGVEEVQKQFKNIVDYPQIKDREEAKSKKGALSDYAIYVAVNESFGCALFA